jgi:hypothetical protein
MKHLPLFICALILCAYYSNAQLTDDFSDGNFSAKPKWIPSADTDWIVNPSFQLQTNRKIKSSKFWISTPQTLTDSVQWEFDIRLDFNPSSTNFVDVYLIASHENPLDTSCTGYFVRIGGKDDEISLFRKDSKNKIRKIIDGDNGLLNKKENIYSIKIIRRKNIGWYLYFDPSSTREMYVSGGTASDTTYSTSKYCIVFVRQSTAKFFQKHFIDNIRIKTYIPDKKLPSVAEFHEDGNKQLRVVYSEPVKRELAILTSNYHINNSINHPISIQTDSLSTNTWICSFDKPFLSETTYGLSIKNIEDVEGNRMKDTIIEFTYYLPKEKDIIINEIMFDPVGAGSDYIEIFNRSAYKINLRNFKLANRNSINLISNIANLFNEDRHINSGEYLVLAEDSFNILSSYRVTNPENLIELPELPSMPNDRGTIVLLDGKDQVMDELSYNDGWHFALLNQREGVALERIDPDKPTNQPDNWMSASKTSGYGTPTAANSQQYSSSILDETITLSNKIFSPDHDGYEDVLMIEYRFPEGGYVLNAIVFDIAGRPIKTLQKQVLCGINGSFRWDGLDDQNRQLPMGHYILFCEVFNLQGRVERYKKEVVLARRL